MADQRDATQSIAHRLEITLTADDLSAFSACRSGLPDDSEPTSFPLPRNLIEAVSWRTTDDVEHGP